MFSDTPMPPRACARAALAAVALAAAAGSARAESASLERTLAVATRTSAITAPASPRPLAVAAPPSFDAPLNRTDAPVACVNLTFAPSWDALPDAAAPVNPDAARKTYTSLFHTAPGREWNKPRHALAPSGEDFLGPFGNEEAALTIIDLPRHTHLIIAADVIIAGDWRGTAPIPSQFKITLNSGEEVCATTFATPQRGTVRMQSYPSPSSQGESLPQTGAIAVNSLGFVDPDTGEVRDSVYRLLFTVRHASSQEVIRFSASGLPNHSAPVASDADSEIPPGATAAFWGLDNVAITTTDIAGGGGWSDDTQITALSDMPGGQNPDTGGSGTLVDNPLGNNPVINPHSGGGGGGGDGGGGGGGGGSTPPTVPAPGSAALYLLGAVTSLRRNRR